MTELSRVHDARLPRALDAPRRRRAVATSTPTRRRRRLVGHRLAGRRARARRHRGVRPRRGRRRVRRRRARPATTRPRARAMGFCLLNNIAVAAAALADRGRAGADRRLGRAPRQRHPGHLLGRPRRALRVDAPVAALPGHRAGHRDRRRRGAPGSTINFPLPAGATGDVALAALDDVVAPAVERFAPTWVLVSAGFDAHRDDPLADLAWSAGDYALLARRVRRLRARARSPRRCSSKAATTSTPSPARRRRPSPPSPATSSPRAGERRRTRTAPPSPPPPAPKPPRWSADEARTNRRRCRRLRQRRGRPRVGRPGSPRRSAPRSSPCTRSASWSASSTTCPFPPNRTATRSPVGSRTCGPRALERSGVRSRRLVRDGPPVPVLLALAEEEDADVIVVGSRGLGERPELLLGSTSTQVAQHPRGRSSSSLRLRLSGEDARCQRTRSDTRTLGPYPERGQTWCHRSRSPFPRP